MLESALPFSNNCLPAHLVRPTNSCLVAHARKRAWPPVRREIPMTKCSPNTRQTALPFKTPRSPSAVSLRAPIKTVGPFAGARGFESGFGAKGAEGDLKPQMYNQGFGVKGAEGDLNPQMYNQGFGAKGAEGDLNPKCITSTVASSYAICSTIAS